MQNFPEHIKLRMNGVVHETLVQMRSSPPAVVASIVVSDLEALFCTMQQEETDARDARYMDAVYEKAVSMNIAFDKDDANVETPPIISTIEVTVDNTPATTDTVETPPVEETPVSPTEENPVEEDKTEEAVTTKPKRRGRPAKTE